MMRGRPLRMLVVAGTVAAGAAVLSVMAAVAPTPVSPAEADAAMAEGDRLVQIRRPGEAIGLYRRAVRIDPALREVVGNKIARAEDQRQGFLSTCETAAGEVGRHACEVAWLPGAPDEASVFRRRGIIYEGEHQPATALDAYMSANRLRPGDRNVAAAIVSLTEATGRADVLGLTARASALITLGRHADAIKPVLQALRSNPDSIELRALLRTAERGAAPAVAATAVPTTLESSSNDANERRYSNAAPATLSH